MNFAFTIEEPYYWDTMRPLFRLICAQGGVPVVFCEKRHIENISFPKKTKYKIFNYKRLESGKLPTMIEPPMPIDVNFFGNHIRVKGALNFFLNHGSGLKVLTSMVMVPGPHIRLVRFKFRYEMLLFAKKYGTLIYYNFGGAQPLQFFDSDKVGFFFAGNFLKLDDYYQNLLEPAEWFENDTKKPKVLLAPTLNAQETMKETIKSFQRRDASTMFKPHYFDRNLVKFKNEDQLYMGEILKAMLAADIVVSDSSSVLYEAALMGKKVVRLNDRDGLHRNIVDRNQPFNFTTAVNLAEAKAMAPLWNEMTTQDYVQCDLASLRYPDHELLSEQFPNISGRVAEKTLRYAIASREQGLYMD